MQVCLFRYGWGQRGFFADRCVTAIQPNAFRLLKKSLLKVNERPDLITFDDGNGNCSFRSYNAPRLLMH